MSSRDVNGTSYGTGDENYAEVIHVAAETIFNFVLGDDGAADYTGFSIQSFLSNEVSNINTYKTSWGTCAILYPTCTASRELLRQTAH